MALVAQVWTSALWLRITGVGWLQVNRCMLLNIMTAEQIFVKMAPLNMYIKYRWVDDVDLKVTHREVLLNNRPKTLASFTG